MAMVGHMAAAALSLCRAEEHDFACVRVSVHFVGPQQLSPRQTEIWVQSSNVHARKIALRALKVTGHHSSQTGDPQMGRPVALDID